MIFAARYYFKYHQNVSPHLFLNCLLRFGFQDWTSRSGWSVIENRDIAYPGDPGFPKLSDKTKPQDFCVKGFDKAPI